MPVELLVLLIEYCVSCLTCPTTGGMCCHLDVLFCRLLDLPLFFSVALFAYYVFYVSLITVLSY